MMTRQLKTEERLHADVQPGDRVIVSYGVVTVDHQEWHDGRERVTYRWREDQPPVTFHASNTVDVVIED